MNVEPHRAAVGVPAGEPGFDRLELIAAMSRDFAASLDIETTLRFALERITGHLGAVAGSLFLLDGSGKKLRCHVSVGPNEITGLELGSDQGIVGRCVQSNRSEIVRDVREDANFHGDFDAKSGFVTRSILCAPLSVQDQRLGAIEVINKAGGDGLFTSSDLTVLEAMSASAALAILNARMAAALVEQERVKRELELAAEIQRSLLPGTQPSGFPVHGINHPARMVSGDFFDYFALDDGRILFNLGDVSGKGMNAALLMAKTASIFRCLGKTVHQPGRLLSMVNSEICETSTLGMFVTMVGGIYDPRTGRVRIANAGHEPPLLVHADGSVTEVPADAPPLGISPLLVGDVHFSEVELELAGGALYLFSDGITEGRLADDRELGRAGIRDLILLHSREPLATRLDSVVAPLRRGAGQLYDDVTILVVDDDRGEVVKGTLTGRSSRIGTGSGEGVLLQLRFPARPDRLKLVRATVSESAKLCGCDSYAALDIVIAVDEACQNVIRHAYKEDPNGEIELEIRRGDGVLTLLLRDWAEPVDVANIRPRELDDIRPGGLGTHFIQEVMDEIEWLSPPSEGGNLLRMVKRLKKPEDGGAGGRP